MHIFFAPIDDQLRMRFIAFGIINRLCEIAELYKQHTPADIAITRCGAITLSEICATGTPAILIPSPNVTGNHQYKNAKRIKSCGGGILIEEKHLSDKTLLDAVTRHERSAEEIRKMKENLLKLSPLGASEKIVAEIEKALEKDDV